MDVSHVTKYYRCNCKYLKHINAKSSGNFVKMHVVFQAIACLIIAYAHTADRFGRRPFSSKCVTLLSHIDKNKLHY